MAAYLKKTGESIRKQHAEAFSVTLRVQNCVVQCGPLGQVPVYRHVIGLQSRTPCTFCTGIVSVAPLLAPACSCRDYGVLDSL